MDGDKSRGHTEAATQHVMRMECTVEYAVQTPEHPSADAPLLAALHGWGQTAPAFLRWFAPLRERGVLVVAPQAPHPFYLDWETKRVGFSWLTRHRRDEAAGDINRYLDRLIGALFKQPGYDDRRLFVLGFSQGASVAYRYAMASRHAVAGVVSCAADLPPDVAAGLSKRTPFPVMLVHGEKDLIVPPSAMQEAHTTLTAHGYPTTVKRFPGGHRIPTKAVEAIADWMDAVVPPK